MVTITARSKKVDASLPAEGQGRIAARSGATAMLANLAGEAGFTPLELMDAALSGCLVLSVKGAARKFGWLERLVRVDVAVTHEKAHGLPSRVAKFTSSFSIEGDFDTEERAALIAEAHRLCTVGNTLEHGAIVIDADAPA